MEPEDLLEELERDVDDMEREFQEAKDPNPEDTMREKQQRAEQLIEEIHGQLKFLKKQMDSKD